MTTLASIDTALLTALEACVAVPQTALAPFAAATRYAGPVTREGLSRVLGSQYPAALLRFDGEVPTRIVNTHHGGHDNVAPRFDAAVGAQHHAVTQTVQRQHLVHFGQAHFPG